MGGASEGGGGAGAAGQRFALSVRRDREREVSWETAQEWGGRIL